MSKTVFVIGAGGSKEVGLPTGNQLKSKIAEKLSFEVEWRELKGGDGAINRVLVGREINSYINDFDVNKAVRDCATISASMPLAISIDNFIDSHKGEKEIELCSKLAITRTILEYEQKCKLFFNKNSELDFNGVEETWFTSFFQLINVNTGIKELRQKLSKICLIIFNYDRCVEHFLFNAIKTYYKINEQAVSEILSDLEVYHPYGCVGSLPWQDKSGNVDFGEELYGQRLLSITSKIKTFTEGISDSNHLKTIRKRVRSAPTLIFIGFAFHKINMDLLYSRSIIANDEINIFATAYQESGSFCEDVKNSLRKLTGAEANNIKIRNELDCYNHFREYQRTLLI